MSSAFMNKPKVAQTEIENTEKQEEGNHQELVLERRIRSTSDDSLQYQFEQHCKPYQPCTCFYPDHPDITIFELGNDITTINAADINGFGPGNCDDLQRLGYSLEGFYMVRFNSKRVKTIYCNFYQRNYYNTAKKPASRKN